MVLTVVSSKRVSCMQIAQPKTLGFPDPIRESRAHEFQKETTGKRRLHVAKWIFSGQLDLWGVFLKPGRKPISRGRCPSNDCV